MEPVALVRDRGSRQLFQVALLFKVIRTQARVSSDKPKPNALWRSGGIRGAARARESSCVWLTRPTSMLLRSDPGAEAITGPVISLGASCIALVTQGSLILQRVRIRSLNASDFASTQMYWRRATRVRPLAITAHKISFLDLMFGRIIMNDCE